MELKRILSRSIIVDRVAERVQKERYLNHVASLNKIGRSLSKQQFIVQKRRQEKYEERLQELRKSRSYVKSLFNTRTLQNESLSKKMEEIDRRKDEHQSNQKKLPIIKISKAKSKQELIRKENQMIVQRIMHERQAKSKEKILDECKMYERYRENLRKIKGTTANSRRLQIIR